MLRYGCSTVKVYKGWDTVGEALQHFVSDLQLEPVIVAALAECELIRSVASCISPVEASISGRGDFACQRITVLICNNGPTLGELGQI